MKVLSSSRLVLRYALLCGLVIAVQSNTGQAQNVEIGEEASTCSERCSDQYLQDGRYCELLPCGDMSAGDRLQLCWDDYNDCRLDCAREPKPRDCSGWCHENLQGCMEEQRFDCPSYAECIDEVRERTLECLERCKQSHQGAPGAEGSSFAVE